MVDRNELLNSAVRILVEMQQFLFQRKLGHSEHWKYPSPFSSLTDSSTLAQFMPPVPSVKL